MARAYAGHFDASRDNFLYMRPQNVSLDVNCGLAKGGPFIYSVAGPMNCSRQTPP